MIDNRAAAEAHIADAIENGGNARADEFDVEAIADALYEIAGGWGVDQIDADDFWPAIEAHAR